MKKKLTFLALTLILILSVCATTVFATTETASLKITAANLSLENAVYMNFKVTHENIDRDDVKLLVWEEMPEAYTKGTEDTCLSAKTDKDGNTFFHYTDLTAKDMTKLIYACAYAKIDGVEYYSAPIKYSIAIYAHRMKASSTDAELLELIDAMLEYGALAQKYFNHNTDILATAPLYQISVNGGKLEDGFAIGWYHEGATATLTANEAEEGYIFSHWENSWGNSVSKDPIINITINEDKVFTAKYKPDENPSIPETPVYSEGLQYTLSTDKTYYIVSGIGDCLDNTIVISGTYKGKPVKEIGSSAFENCSHITSVVIPEDVQVIRSEAFFGCTSLVSIKIPEGVTFEETDLWGGGVFEECTNLTSIILPDGMPEIPNRMFWGCEKLVSITIPDSVTYIGSGAFGLCKSLVNITLSQYVTGMGGDDMFAEGAFVNCTNLVSFTAPNMTFIGRYAFAGCKSLANVTVSKNLTFICMNAFGGCTNLKSIIIPRCIEKIGSDAFGGWTNLQSIYFEFSPYIVDDTLWYSPADYMFEDGNPFPSNILYHYSEITYPQFTDLKLWRYVDGVPTPW